MKYLFESLEEQKRIPINKLSWDKVELHIDPTNPKSRFRGTSIYLPSDFMSSSIISNDIEFERWYKQFINKWGLEGELIEIRPGSWTIQGNQKWDEAYKRGSGEVSDYYAKKGSGGYTGD